MPDLNLGEYLQRCDEWCSSLLRGKGAARRNDQGLCVRLVEAEQPRARSSHEENKANTSKARRRTNRISRPSKTSHSGHRCGHTSRGEARKDSTEEMRRRQLLKHGPHQWGKHGCAASDHCDQRPRSDWSIEKPERRDGKPTDG